MPQSRADSPSPEEQPKRPIDSPVDLSKPQKIARVDSGDQQSESLKPEARKMGFQRYLVAVEYIGTKFSGSQKQLNGRTVEGVVEDAFYKFIGQPVSISFSSRTDVGVHALSNTFHVDVERISKRKPGEVKNEGDIMLLDVRTIPANFHARFNAKERIYYYRILSGQDALSIFEKERAWHVPEKLDLLAMQKACSILVGHHDFSSFRSAGCQAKSPVKTLDELRVCEVIPSSSFPSNTDNGQKDGGLFGGRKSHRLYMITARARSFLYHQVRLLVGLLKSVGTGELKIDDVERILNARTITETPPMAPACGLYLGNVMYDFLSDDD
ncbi:uncharacterized protein LOC116266561 isoform X2 [Nymphaea colorata]|uniref:uncharacterized protein LOC116266561 isoform X2 n=1 Tax=Nymphaea colorata TaxID=210225 RepID=UPI00129EC6B1|nr:uncharacterized protein LOC116266561 isoform X2 [Nymphaea colorata]